MTMTLNGRRCRRAHRKRRLARALLENNLVRKPRRSASGRNGVIVWKGPSALDGRPIMAIATGFGKTKNRKTGALIQLWIMRSDVSPIEATFMGKDKSICGDCKHRPNSPWHKKGWGTCYVVLTQGPAGVWGAYSKGAYSLASDEQLATLLAGRRVRLGAYGDPAALPFELVEKIVGLCERHTGYTHQWQRCDQRLKRFLMASADTPEEAIRAQLLGWRTFRVRTPDEPVKADERVCPASEEAGKIAKCATCMACHGTGHDDNQPNQRANVVIQAHGDWKMQRFIQLRVLQKQHKPTLPVIAEIVKNRHHKTQYRQKNCMVHVRRDRYGRVISQRKVPLPVLN